MEEEKTREQLIEEVEELRHRVEELEALLRMNEEKFRQLFSAVSDAILIMDAYTFQIVDVNGSAERQYGYTREEFLGLKVTDISAEPDATKEIIERAREGITDVVPLRYHRKKDGTIIIIEASLAKFTLGSRVLVYSLNRDITESKRMEEEIRAAQQRLLDIIDFLPDATFVIDRQGKVIAWNRAIEAMTGLRKEDIIGKGDYAYSVPFYGEPRPILIDLVLQPQDEIEKRYEFVKRRGQTLTAEAFIPSMNGKDVYLWGIAEPLLNPNGNVVGAIESIRDITERKRIEEALAKEEMRYRELANSITDVFFAMDDDLRYTYWNKASEELTGIRAEEAIGKSLYEIFPSVKGTRAEMGYLAVLKTGQPQSFEQEYLLGEKVYFFEISVYPSKTGISVFIKDITEQKRAEAALRESEERYRTLFTQSPIGIITCDRQGNLLSLNPALLQIIGSPGEEASLQANVFASPWLASTNLPSDLRRCLEEDRQIVSEQLYSSRWGREAMVRLRLTPLKDDEGEIGGAFVTVEDITEQRRLEAQLRQVQRLEAVGTLAGGVAHEFNNLLTGIIGNLSLVMADVEPDSQTYRDLQAAERSARRAAELTRQLLAFGRKSRSEQFKQMSLNPVIEEVIALLRQTVDPRIEIYTQLAADLWAVEAATSQINQMLMNLCLNARDAIMEYLLGKRVKPEERRAGPYVIFIKTENAVLDERYCRDHPEARPGQFVRLTVSDNGCGMTANTQTRLFEPFFTTKEVGQGTGLGLFMVFGIVEGYDGFIGVQSRPEVGTIFRIHLPRAGERGE